MIYNLANKQEQQRFTEKFAEYLNSGFIVELIKKRKPKTVSQNSYLHAIISIFAIEFGYTLEESKTLLKRSCSFMRYEKNGQWFLTRTRDLDTKQMASFVDWIRNYSAKQGLYLLDAEEYLENKFKIDSEIQKNKQYL